MKSVKELQKLEDQWSKNYYEPVLDEYLEYCKGLSTYWKTISDSYKNLGE
jgi:hypothetical protein